ncbi:J protein JJJ2 [Argentina anserina]|uniref:J protein JJJ2 n=1 Tax=Argentina anserina TaxID=57926 RepID=UPI0021768306|nr:J protein JJJ2 [Potentilla anserina]
MGQHSDFKSQLVTEICSLSKFSVACSHRHCTNPAQSFVDWYRLLGVEETAGIDVIRKRYHELALQLHPDKNKHANAEVAFKLVSEAYSCLSDDENRRAFDLERWNNFCFKCGAIPYTAYKTPNNAKASEHKAWNPISRSRSCKVIKGLKDIRNRFREEAKVIENCLKVNNAASRNETSLFSPPSYVFQGTYNARSNRETPVFNPSDHVVQGYPHLRTRIYEKDKSRSLWCLRTGHHILNCEQGRDSRATCDSPVFEIRSDRGILKSRSTCVRS